MINFFKVWCENVIIAIVVAILIEMICPERNIKYIKIVIGFFILYIIISPIVDNISIFKNFNFKKEIEVISNSLIEKDTNVEINNKFNLNNKSDEINESFINGLEYSLFNKLKENNINCNSIEIKFDEKNNEFEKVEIDLINLLDVENEGMVKKIILEELDIDINKININ